MSVKNFAFYVLYFCSVLYIYLLIIVWKVNVSKKCDILSFIFNFTFFLTRYFVFWFCGMGYLYYILFVLMGFFAFFLVNWDKELHEMNIFCLILIWLTALAL